MASEALQLEEPDDDVRHITCECDGILTVEINLPRRAGGYPRTILCPGCRMAHPIVGQLLEFEPSPEPANGVDGWDDDGYNDYGDYLDDDAYFRGQIAAALVRAEAAEAKLAALTAADPAWVAAVLEGRAMGGRG